MQDLGSFSRRKFAGIVCSGGAGLALSGCTTVNPLHGSTILAPCPAPLKIARNRLIREMVGLRPYRARGFVVRRESLGDKTLVHNYGHGGAGITLSWGTSRMAADLGLPGHQGPVAVLGSGVVGLTTARLIQEAGFPVTIYAAALPPDTTSNIAGAGWYPSSLFDRSSVPDTFQSQLEAALRYAYLRFQLMVGPEYGIRWLKQYEIYSAPAPQGPRHWFTTMMESSFLPEVRELDPGQHPFGQTYVREYNGIVIETDQLLQQLLIDFRVAGGKVVVKKFNEPVELADLPEQLIFNATRLGSRALFNDLELRPMRGQLAVLLPQPEVDYGLTHEGGLYMFSRRDGIVLGGTNELDDWNLSPDPATTDRLLEGHQKAFSRISCI